MNTTTSEEIFAGTVTLMANNTEPKLRISLSIQQKIVETGCFALRPTLSLSVVIPEDSDVFRFVQCGNMDSLLEILSLGQAALGVCDTSGRTLLHVRFHFPTCRYALAY